MPIATETYPPLFLSDEHHCIGLEGLQVVTSGRGPLTGVLLLYYEHRAEAIHVTYGDDTEARDAMYTSIRTYLLGLVQ